MQAIQQTTKKDLDVSFVAYLFYKFLSNKDNNKQELKLNFTYDEEKFAELEENIKSQVDIEPENAITF